MPVPGNGFGFRRQAFLIALAGGLVIVFITVFATMSVSLFNDAESAWEEHSQKATAISDAFADLHRYLGYGGFIHNFKNLVLRRDLSRYQALIERDLAGLKGALDRLDGLLEEPEDRAALARLRATVTEYANKYGKVAAMISAGNDSAQIDAIVKVSDMGALAAIAHLEARAGERARETERKARKTVADGILFLRIGGMVVIAAVIAGMAMLVVLLGRIVSSNETVRKTGERLDLATRAAQIGIWDWHIPTDRLEWDDRTFDLYGVKKEEFGGVYDAWLSGVHPEDRAMCDEAIRRALGNERKFDIEFRVRRPDGMVRVIKAEAGVARDPQGKPLRMTGVNYDITERKRLEAALERQQRRHERILNSVGVGVHGLDLDGRIVFENPASATMFGWEVSEMIGRQAHATIHHTRADGSPYPQAECPIYATRLDGVLRHVDDEVFWRRDGTSFPVLYSATPIHDDAGGITGAVVAFRDITERKRFEAQLRAKNDELKGFAYTVSHDLKAPLRGISGYAQELERRHKEGLSERGQFCVTQIISATGNLDRLIEDLLKYSRLDAETPTPSEVNLPDLVQSILRDRAHTLDELGVVVDVTVPPIVLRAWERGLHQVLTNLIDNALKYSRQSKPPRLAITAENLPGSCRITVADNGIGFDMKYQDRIFGLFNRLVRASEFEGTGAGLAIVKKLMEKLGGSVRAESAPGQGATFFVDLPNQAATRDSP